MFLVKWLPTILLYTASFAVLGATLWGGYGPRLAYVAVGAALLIAGRIEAHFADSEGRRNASRP